MQDSDKIIIYTDGGCRGNPGIGGWGVWLRYNGSEKKLKGGERLTTNNKMELTAAIEALKTLTHNQIPIILYTDSTYVMKGITEWIVGWKRKNWKNVKNIELWQELDSLSSQFDIDWRWVKGHSGDEGNDMVDLLANQAMDEIGL